MSLGKHSTTDAGIWAAPEEYLPTSYPGLEYPCRARQPTPRLALAYSLRRTSPKETVAFAYGSSITVDKYDPETFFEETQRSTKVTIPQQFSEAAFHNWAVNDPGRLIALLQSDLLRPSDLTFAAEAAGHLEDSATARMVLTSLLDHEAALVREGAIYGLLHHLDAEVRELLSQIAQDDVSPGVREAASEASDAE